MIYTPNMAITMPPDGNWNGSARVERVSAHPSLLFVPNRVETMEGSAFFGAPIDQGLLDPPASVMAAMYASEWTVDISIFGPGGPLTVTKDIEANKSTWSEVLKSGHVLLVGEGQPIDSSDFTSVSLSISSFSIAFSWGEKYGWWPGFDCLVSSRTFDPDNIAANASISPAGGKTECDIIVDITNNKFPLYYESTNQSGLSGTIKLTPKSYLDLA